MIFLGLFALTLPCFGAAAIGMIHLLGFQDKFRALMVCGSLPTLVAWAWLLMSPLPADQDALLDPLFRVGVLSLLTCALLLRSWEHRVSARRHRGRRAIMLERDGHSIPELDA